MAMEKLYVIRDTHSRPITAIGYNPARREILIGCEGILFGTGRFVTGLIHDLKRFLHVLRLYSVYLDLIMKEWRLIDRH